MLIDKAVKAAKGQTWDVSREQAARQQFNELDKDGNKSLSEEEFIEYYANLWEGKTDAQFNGEIDDFQEGMRAFLQKTIDTTRNETVNTQEDNVRLQGLLDALKNSTLEGSDWTDDDRAAARNYTRKVRLGNLFDILDIDNGGSLCKDEFTELCAEMAGLTVQKYCEKNSEAKRDAAFRKLTRDDAADCSKEDFVTFYMGMYEEKTKPEGTTLAVWNANQAERRSTNDSNFEKGCQKLLLALKELLKKRIKDFEKVQEELNQANIKLSVNMTLPASSTREERLTAIFNLFDFAGVEIFKDGSAEMEAGGGTLSFEQYYMIMREMAHPDVKYDRTMAQGEFEAIDTDKSGSIELTEFLESEKDILDHDSTSDSRFDDKIAEFTMALRKALAKLLQQGRREMPSSPGRAPPSSALKKARQQANKQDHVSDDFTPDHLNDENDGSFFGLGIVPTYSSAESSGANGYMSSLIHFVG